MKPIPLHNIWTYTDVDRAFWERHLEPWLPERIVDAHTHVADPAFRLAPMTEAKRKQYWVSEVSSPIPAPDAERACRIVFPGREVRCLVMGHPSLDYDVEACNDYVAAEAQRRGSGRRSESTASSTARACSA